MHTAPRPPIEIPRLLDDDALIRELAEADSPYLPTQGYFANTAEYEALSGESGVDEMPIASLFRGVWGEGEDARVEGAQALVDLPAFHDAAAALFGGTVVRPLHLYSNLTYQLPFAQGQGHTDITAFRGFDRSEHPIALLSIMGHSGLFEDVRLRIATAVSWFYRGSDGGFEYWPKGPDAPSVRHEGDIHNTAIVADNDLMWHRALGTGAMDDGMLSGLTLTSQLVFDGDDRWRVVDDGQTLAELGFDDLRISVSWKALVFADEDEAAAYDAGEGGIDLEEVLRRFHDDLSARGEAPTIPDDEPERDPALIRALHQAYVTKPDAPLM